MSSLWGRGDAIARTQERAEGALRGAGGLLLFVGESGIGKSTVIDHAASLAARDGARVAWGRCWEVGGAPAYWPWIQVFRALGLAELFETNVHDLTGGAESARFNAFDLVVRRLKAAAEPAPLTLALDDLHAADLPSLLLLLLLARELRSSRILVLGAYRDAGAELEPECASLLGKISRESELIPLGRLPAQDVRAFLREAEPRTSEADATLLYELTEGHPLLMCEALRLGPDARTQPRILEGLKGVLDERLARLSERTRAILGTAAVLGREFTARELAMTGRLDHDEVHAALGEARAAGIVTAALSAERQAFSHVLHRDRLYAALLPSSRAALHWQAGLAKLELGDGPAAAVHHWFEGYAAGHAEQLAAVALAAAEASLAQLAFEDAVRLAETALGLVERELGPGRLLCQLRIVLAESSIRSGAGARGKELAAEAAHLAEAIDDGELVARAALVYATELAAVEIEPRMVELLRRALSRLPDEDSPVRARVMARLGAALAPPRSEDEVVEILRLRRASLGLARRLGDGHTLLYVLQFSLGGLMVGEEERLALLQETMLLGESLAQRLVLLATFGGYITTLLAVGRRSDADAALASYEALAEEFPRPQVLMRLRLVQALVAQLDGHRERAAALSGQALLLGERAGIRAGVRLCRVQRFSLALLACDPASLAADAEPTLALLDAAESLTTFAGWILAGIGRREEAVLRLRNAEVHPQNLLGVLGAAETCLLLAERELAPHYYELLRRFSGRMLWSMSTGCLLGPTARTLGDLAALCGDGPAALRHYDEALAFSERLRAPLLVSVCKARRDALSREFELARPPSVASSAPSAPVVRRIELLREGDVWAVVHGHAPAFRLKHSKGLDYLQALLARPGLEMHVSELTGSEQRAGDAGPLLDTCAKEEYRARLEDLRDDLAQAESFADEGRAERARAELDAIAEQLAGAVGLGGRDRRAASDSERARINVQRRLKDAIDRIASEDPELGRYLGLTIKTGTFCGYTPL